MMKVFYDYQAFFMQKFGGISRYFYELIKNRQGLYDYSFPRSFSDNIYMNELQGERNFPIKADFKGKTRIINYLNQAESKKIIKKGAFEIFHPTYYDSYFLNSLNGKKFVLTIHDMIHEIFPENFSKKDRTKELKKKLAFKAERIIAISESTKNDIIKFYPDLNPEKIDVVYHGNPFEKAELSFSASEKNGPYILFTGQRGGYKNFTLFVKAVAPLLKKYNLKLKCTGHSFNREEQELFDTLKISDRCECTFASDDELKKLYANALVFAFPSLYEGFGFPILEAFSCGCPVALSCASCFPEIAGDSAIYFDPNSETDIRNKIENIITSESARSELIKKGFERAKTFSWQKCAAETSKVYEKAMK